MGYMKGVLALVDFEEGIEVLQTEFDDMPDSIKMLKKKHISPLGELTFA